VPNKASRQRSNAASRAAIGRLRTPAASTCSSAASINAGRVTASAAAAASQAASTQLSRAEAAMLINA
jgi:hypothetical protein